MRFSFSFITHPRRDWAMPWNQSRPSFDRTHNEECTAPRWCWGYSSCPLDGAIDVDWCRRGIVEHRHLCRTSTSPWPWKESSRRIQSDQPERLNTEHWPRPCARIENGNRVDVGLAYRSEWIESTPACSSSAKDTLGQESRSVSVLIHRRHRMGIWSEERS